MVVAEAGTNALHVGEDGIVRVKPYVGVECGQARRDVAGREAPEERLGLVVPQVAAAERTGVAGAAKVDEDQIAFVPDCAEHAGEECRVGARALSGSAGEDEQRIRSGRGGLRRQHGDVERDASAVAVRVILEDVEDAALRFLRQRVDRARRQVQPATRRWLGATKRRCQRDNPESSHSASVPRPERLGSPAPGRCLW